MWRIKGSDPTVIHLAGPFQVPPHPRRGLVQPPDALVAPGFNKIFIKRWKVFNEWGFYSEPLSSGQSTVKFLRLEHVKNALLHESSVFVTLLPISKMCPCKVLNAICLCRKISWNFCCSHLVLVLSSSRINKLPNILYYFSACNFERFINFSDICM